VDTRHQRVSPRSLRGITKKGILLAVMAIALSACSEGGTLPIHLQNDEGLYIQVADSTRLESGTPMVKVRLSNDAPIPQVADLTCTFRSGEYAQEAFYRIEMGPREWEYVYVMGPRIGFGVRAQCEVERGR